MSKKKSSTNGLKQYIVRKRNSNKILNERKSSNSLVFINPKHGRSYQDFSKNPTPQPTIFDLPKIKVLR